MSAGQKPKPKRIDSAGTGRSGVHAVGLTIERGLDWIFREQPDNDYGIDAHIEVVEDESVTGKLLALQIKSSRRHFKKPKKNTGWWFSPKETHVNYWLDHALPVAIVLYDRDSNTAYWQAVTEKTLVKKKGKWKIFVPSGQVLDEDARGLLSRLAEGDPYVLRLRRLRFALPWMELLQSGRRIIFDVEEWMHKSSGRGSFMLRSIDEDNEDSQDLGEWQYMFPFRRYEDVLPALFPWADVTVHEETYDAAQYEQYESECVIWDEEKYFTESFEDWNAGRETDGLRPYDDNGEVAWWRLEITLNDLGQAFLLIDQFAKQEGVFLLPGH
jgi:hypothetical protein